MKNPDQTRPLQHWQRLRIAMRLSALALSMLAANSALADIYMQQDVSEEIHLTNLVPQSGQASDNRGYIVLVEEEKPVAAVSSGNKTTLKQRAGSKATAGLSAWASAHPYATLVQHAAQQRLLDPVLIYAVMATESANNPLAVSRSGARGLMQLMPATARRYQVADPHDPKQNIDAGARYLQELQATFKGDIALMLAAYNAGPNAVIRHGYRIPPYAETLNYVPRVLNLYKAQSRPSSTD